MLQMSHSARGAWTCHVTDRRSISEAQFLSFFLQIACFLLARFLLGSTGQGLEGDATPFLRNSTGFSPPSKKSIRREHMEECRGTSELPWAYSGVWGCLQWVSLYIMTFYSKPKSD